MRWRRIPSVVLLVVLAVLVVLTPVVVLVLIALKGRLSWQRLGEVGEAFGAVSAVVSAMALLGVVTSLVIQQRQNRVTEEQTVRQRHFELVRLTMEEPKFLYAWGYQPERDHDPALLGFGNLIVSHWYMLWRIRNIDEEALRRNVAVYFGGSVGRNHWRRAGPDWATPDRRARQFVAILDQEYRRAVSAGPPSSVPPPAPARPATSRKEWRLVAGAAMAGATFLMARQAGRRWRARLRSSGAGRSRARLPE
jgi:hypothetical protein